MEEEHEGRVHERVLGLLRELPGAESLEIPPPVFEELGGRFVDFDPGGSATCRWPVRPEQRGPDGSLQGGVLTAFFDNTFGPVAFVGGRGFYVSLDLTTDFVRRVGPSVDRLTVRARIADRTERLLLLDAEAERPDGKLVARCHSKMIERAAADRGGRETTD